MNMIRFKVWFSNRTLGEMGALERLYFQQHAKKQPTSPQRKPPKIPLRATQKNRAMNLAKISHVLRFTHILANRRKRKSRAMNPAFSLLQTSQARHANNDLSTETTTPTPTRYVTVGI
jgi:hypothetical protein